MNAFANDLLHSSWAAICGRTENAMPRRAKPIDDAAIERQLGTDDREIEALAIGERTELVDGATLNGFRARVARDPGVARACTSLRWQCGARARERARVRVRRSR